MKKTAVILTIVSAFLWVVFVAIRLLKPDYSFLTCRMELWLFALCTLLTSVSAAFWLAMLIRRRHLAVKIITWIGYGAVSILWWLYMVLIICFPWGYLADHYPCSNDKRYVMYSDFDGTYYNTYLLHKHGILDTNICSLDFYLPFDNPQLFVYEDADAIVLRYGMKDSIYTDVFHFNGKSYIGSAKDSVLMAVKLSGKK